MSTAGEEAWAADEHRDVSAVILALLDWLRGALGFTMDGSADEEREVKEGPCIDGNHPSGKHA